MYCTMLPHEACNTSDHLPILLKFTVNCSTFTRCVSTPSKSISTLPVFPNWSKASRNDTYCEILCTKLSEICRISDKVRIASDDNVQDIINSQIHNISAAIHDATIESGCSTRCPRPPKPYWCPELANIRDKKRFWWQLWIDNGRPRNGIIFSIYKHLKKHFRRTCRHYVNNTQHKQLMEIHHHFYKRNMRSFWNLLKRQHKNEVQSALLSNDFAMYYRSVMSDEESKLDIHQSAIKNFVIEKMYSVNNRLSVVQIQPEEIKLLISSMKRGVCPGQDNICVEHFVYGSSVILCEVLADLYSAILSTTFIPDVIATGVIIPVLKKSTLDSNRPENYRPITLSSTYSRLLELLIAPDYSASDTQFGFRKGRSTTFVTSLINDMCTYFNANGSPVYLCTLDAEKCFDSIWHTGLFYKLWDKLPAQHWLLLFNWYKATKSLIRWNNVYSSVFSVTRGMRQGSLLSPTLFNIFIDDLMIQLKNANAGTRIDDLCLNSSAYADDVTVFSATVPGLQTLIDISASYAAKWRFNFSNRKTKCIIIGKSLMKSPPVWKLNDYIIDISKEVEILGVTFSSDNKPSSHIQKRITSCRKSIYSLSAVGMSYPGIHTDIKAHIWKTVGTPTLLYGMDSLSLSPKDCNILSSTATSLIKSVLGLPKRSHHSNILEALDIPSITREVKYATVGLYQRIFRETSPTCALQTRLLSRYLLTGQCINGTLLSSVVKYNVNPVTIILDNNFINKRDTFKKADGIVDSLKYLLYSENYVKPWSDEFILTRLLTKAF